jgi:DNA (cytosine-5)-methyltransferase 1
MKFLDLFSGIGGFRLGMESVGHECIGFCEIDKFARESYKSIFQTEGEIEFHDIRDVSDDEFKKLRGKVDVICGGFPCQAFSIAGRRLGFEDTRGTLFFEIARAAKQIQPRFLFLENVKGLLNHDKGRTFTTILTTLDELGFDVEWQVLNSKDFGVPQNRERVFIIGHLRGECTRRIFPLSSASKQVDKHQKLSTNTLTTRYPNSQGVGSYIIESESQRVSSIGNINKSGRGMNGEVYQADGLAPTLTTNKGEGQKIAIPVLTPDQSDKRQNGRRFKTDGEPMFTLTAQDRHGVLIKEATKKGYSEAEIGDSVNLSHPNSKTRRGRVGKQIANTLLTGESQGVVEPDFRIRKLTPRECWRLQGFPDWAFDKAQEVNSNSQLYKQAGNSVTVNVIAVIAKELK